MKYAKCPWTGTLELLPDNNIHGYCPYCYVSLDGENILDSYIKGGYTKEDAERNAESFDGWDEHGKNNKWNKKIGISCMEKDRVVAWKCPECNGEWNR